MKKAVLLTSYAWPDVCSGGGKAVLYSFLTGLDSILEWRENFQLLGLFGNKLLNFNKNGSIIKSILVPPINYSPVGNWLLIRKIWLQMACFRQLIQRFEKILVVGFSPVHGFLLCNKNNGVRVTYCEHAIGGVAANYLMSKGKRNIRFYLLNKLHGWMFDNADAVIFPSKGAFELFKANNPELAIKIQHRLRIIHNGIKPISLLPYPKSINKGFTVLIVSRHIPQKNLDGALYGFSSFIELLRKRNSSVSNIRLIIIGKPTYELTPKLYCLIQKFHLSSNVTFVESGDRDQMGQLYSNANVLLHVPKVAVFDLVVLEAMSIGLPVVASPTGGNIEALGHDYGLFARNTDEIAQKLLQIYEGLGLEYVDVLKRRYEQNFTLETMTQKYLAFIDELLF